MISLAAGFDRMIIEVGDYVALSERVLTYTSGGSKCAVYILLPQ